MKKIKKILPVILLIITGIINIEYKVFGSRYPDWSQSRQGRSIRPAQSSAQPSHTSSNQNNIIEEEPVLRELLEVKEFDILLDREYLLALRRDIRRAEKSIYVVMYFINVEGSPDQVVNRLLGEIIKLTEKEDEEKNIKVEIYLDNSLQEDNESVNKPVYERLKNMKGIDVKMNKARLVNHYKLVIIDDEIIYCGSHNWTISALLISTEATVRLKSASIAADIKQHFEDTFGKWYD